MNHIWWAYTIDVWAQLMYLKEAREHDNLTASRVKTIAYDSSLLGLVMYQGK